MPKKCLCLKSHILQKLWVNKLGSLLDLGQAALGAGKLNCFSR